MRQFLLPTLFSLLCFVLPGQEQTVGLFEYQPESYNGYTLFSPLRNTSTYLIDNCGRLVHSWESEYFPGAAMYLLEDGRLLRTATMGVASNPVIGIGGAGDRMQMVDWNGNVEWDFVYSDSLVRLHHDMARLPNGNILMIAWELRSYEECIQAGRNPDLLPDSVVWSEQVIEVDPDTDEIVWKWSFWDHLIQDFDPTKDNYGTVEDHPELLDVNFTAGPTSNGGADWLHFNAIDYNAELDQILLTSNFLSEVYIIDHSTTTEQAAGHSGGNANRGGDILYRWGNPQVYRQGGPEDQQFYRPHDARWIEPGLPDEGKIMVFNNGAGRPDGAYSSVEVFTPPLDDYIPDTYVYIPGTAFLPNEPDWIYTAEEPTDFYSSFISGARRLPNGHTLICSGAKGRFFEVTPDREIVWEYVSPVTHEGVLARDEEIPILSGRNANIVFRATRYEEDYGAFAGRDMTPGDPIELNYPQPYDCQILSSTEEPVAVPLRVYPNPVCQGSLTVEAEEPLNGQLQLFDLLGRPVRTETARDYRTALDVSDLPAGMYLLTLEGVALRKVVVE